MNGAFAAALDEIEREIADAKASQAAGVSYREAAEAGESEGGAAADENMLQIVVSSSTPKSPRRERLKLPSKYKVTPFDHVAVSSEQEDVYAKILRSCKSARGSRIKRYLTILFSSFFYDGLFFTSFFFNILIW